MSELHEVIGNYPEFLDDILGRVENAGFDFADFSQIDHMCYRAVSAENYARKKTELQSVARLLGETEINNRPISTFRLNEPVCHGKWRIDAIELPAPKPDNIYKEGLEHVELVLFDDFPTFLKKYEGKDFEMFAANRGINPEIGFKLGEYSVKFHLLALTTVVFLENKPDIRIIMDVK